jgi:hypothetical protein
VIALRFFGSEYDIRSIKFARNLAVDIDLGCDELDSLHEKE